jgi:sulfur-carrier protein
MEHEVWIPALHRDLTGGVETIKVSATSVGELIDRLDEQFPGMRDRLSEDGRIKPYISIAINGEVMQRGLRQKLTQPSEIHFVPAVGGG